MGNFSMNTFIASTAMMGLAVLRFFSRTIVFTVHQAIRKNTIPTVEPKTSPLVTAQSPSISDIRISAAAMATDKKKFFLGSPRSEAYFLVTIVIYL